MMEECEFMETIDFGEIPEIDGSKFQAYIDFNRELEIKFIKMQRRIDYLTEKLEEIKIIAIDSISWSNFWKNKYIEK